MKNIIIVVYVYIYVLFVVYCKKKKLSCESNLVYNEVNL